MHIYWDPKDQSNIYIYLNQKTIAACIYKQPLNKEMANCAGTMMTFYWDLLQINAKKLPTCLLKYSKPHLIENWVNAIK